MPEPWLLGKLVLTEQYWQTGNNLLHLTLALHTKNDITLVGFNYFDYSYVYKIKRKQPLS